MKVLVLGVLLGAALAGCGEGQQFGVGVGQQFQTMKTGVYDGADAYSGPTQFGTNKMSLMANSITIYDTSGILLAGIGGGAAAFNAQQKAREAAIKSGAQVGDSYSYSYEVYTPVPGQLTTIRYTWSESDSYDNSMGAPSTPVSYSDTDLG